MRFSDFSNQEVECGKKQFFFFPQCEYGNMRVHVDGQAVEYPT